MTEIWVSVALVIGEDFPEVRCVVGPLGCRTDQTFSTPPTAISPPHVTSTEQFVVDFLYLAATDEKLGFFWWFSLVCVCIFKKIITSIISDHLSLSSELSP